MFPLCLSPTHFSSPCLLFFFLWILFAVASCHVMHTNKIHRQQELSNFISFLFSFFFGTTKKIRQRLKFRGFTRVALSETELGWICNMSHWRSSAKRPQLISLKCHFTFRFQCFSVALHWTGKSSFGIVFRTIEDAAHYPINTTNILFHFHAHSSPQLSLNALFTALIFMFTLSRANIFFSRAFCRYRVRVSRRF